ncbi:MAG TPA: DNA-directed RNA polymerase subunit alpha C-terminal domain-containing protein [Pirellulales bacterium]|jgi:DNA-directed RNA polymerase subunit alpha|nr:DNA-directed RNA polymerase subunit alpha C-terminal domain-containing protein [Pirellulales bacterium]
MAQITEVDVKQFVLAGGPFGPQEIKQIVNAVAEDTAQYRAFRDAVGELEMREDRSPAAAVRLGVCFYLLGRYSAAIQTLKSSDGGALAHFYMAKGHFALEQYAEAIQSYAAAAKAGYNADECMLGRAEAQRMGGDGRAALASLDSLSGAVEQTAEYLFQRGATISALGGNPSEVIALFERAVDADPNHVGALFGLAKENDRRGNDEVALDLYERSAAQFPTYVGTLLNLGVLYEDRQQYDRAAQCYLRILDAEPNHARARLFLKDAQASGDMFYDEDAQRKRDRASQVLGVPVSDFELSVRSRNCLQKMGILTLGDLARCTEQELLASKNFGETSLVEIREMLASKGLSLGQLATVKAEPEPTFEPEFMSPDEQALLDRPIADLNLSVRARKCMIRLGLNTIGELLRRTGDDLLECKNFGVTSLNEVREKLTVQGLKLRGD